MDHAVQQIAELEKEMADPGFWNDSDRAAATINSLKGLKAKVEKYNAVYKEFEDLKVLFELAAEEEDDGALASEIQDSFPASLNAWSSLRLKRCLTANTTTKTQYFRCIRVPAGWRPRTGRKC